VRRREFITLLGGATIAPALLWPPGARAQQAGRTPRIGVLMAGNESAPDNQARIAAFRRGLADLG
jgi:putative ABC transport system substrate-binding protein